MQKISHDFERITISLPSTLSRDIDELKKELNVSKSEIFKRAFEKFLEDYRKKKLRQVARKMVQEYKTNKELTAFHSLDQEDFR